ncbi:MAG: hypothetical protein CVT82_07275 [Alphaproteobacteria bacterium HGW-Alphaproteobacteria-4]|jgi:hypothetical protein|nr:MAG: hypothetical protein CVT82_07275 [Alphaproteobacteria bacterium HGW-Alphaproteobacteria-4]
MGGEGNADLHFWITRGMARRQGINLNALLSEGVVTRGDVAEMVARCRGCPGMQGCLTFLSEHPTRADAAPDWCRNAQLLAELRAIT